MSPDTVTAIAAVAVAVIALFVSIAERNRARLHDRLAVRPLIRIDSFTRADGGAQVSITNSGLGPALIQQIGVGYNSEPVFPAPGTDDGIPWDAALANRDESLVPRYALFLPEPGEPLAQGEEQVLLTFPSSNGSEEAKRELRRLMHTALSVEVRYESIYGEQFTAASTPLAVGEETPAA